jgi:hypothetical protein
MIDNKKFNAVLSDSGMTMYALAKRSGVPYTTINEIHNGKNDINQCAAGTVFRLAATLGVAQDEIINDINFLDGVRGRYKGIDYTWSTDGCSCITFEYNGEPITLSAGAYYNIPSRLAYYNTVAGWMIKEHIEKLEWKNSVHKKIKELKNE